MLGELSVNYILAAARGWSVLPSVITPLFSSGLLAGACSRLLVGSGCDHLGGLLEIACKLLKSLFCRALILNGLSRLLDQSFGAGFFIYRNLCAQVTQGALELVSLT